MGTLPHVWLYGPEAGEPRHLEAVLTAFSMQTEIQHATAFDVVTAFAEGARD